MSEILFQNLSISNFLSIGEGQIDLENRGLLLIQGMNEDDPSANSNGAGKSSCVDALCWALYGTTARGLSGDAVVNRFEGSDCRVAVDFTLDGKAYTVARHRKHKKGKNRLTFACDGADLTQGTDKLTQELIVKTIGCDLEVFTASIYAGQNHMPNLPAMTDKELKQLVENAAGIEVLDAAYAIARDRLRAAETALGAAESKHDTAVALRDSTARSLEELAGERDTWDASHAERVDAAKSRLRTALTTAKTARDAAPTPDDVEAQEAKIASIEAEIKKASATVHTPPTPPTPPKLGVIGPAPAPFVPPAKPPAITTLVTELHRKESWLTIKRDELRKALLAFKAVDDSVGQPCDSCGKPYSAEDLATVKASRKTAALDIQATIKQWEKDVADLKGQLDQLEEEHSSEVEAQQAKWEAQKKAAEALDAAIEADNARLTAEFDAAQESYQNALREHRAAIASSDSTKLADALRDAHSALNAMRAERSKIDKLVAVAQEQKRALDAVSEEVNPYTGVIEAKRDQLEKQVEAAKAARVVVDEALVKVGDAAVVAELYSPKGVRGEVLDSVTPFLNARTAQYLGTLSDGSISAEWKTIGETGKGELREKFHICVSNANGAEVYEGLSGGEQRKVRISTAMALQDLVASRADRPIKLFVADEVDDALDVSGLERLMDVLEEKAKFVGSVLVISHNQLDDFISNAVTVVKKGGKSAIVEV